MRSNRDRWVIWIRKDDMTMALVSYNDELHFVPIDSPFAIFGGHPFPDEDAAMHMWDYLQHIPRMNLEGWTPEIFIFET